MYCKKCDKETYHEIIYDMNKSFIDGFLMNLSKGLSLMFQDNTIILKCKECGEEIEKDLEME